MAKVARGGAESERRRHAYRRLIAELVGRHNARHRASLQAIALEQTYPQVVADLPIGLSAPRPPYRGARDRARLRARPPVGQVDGAPCPFTLRRPCGGQRGEAPAERIVRVVVLLRLTARRHDLQVIGSDAARVGEGGCRTGRSACSAAGVVVAAGR